MTYYICRIPNQCYQLGRLLPSKDVEGFNVIIYSTNSSEDVWDWGHRGDIDKTHEFSPGTREHEVCEAAWAAFALGSREAAYDLLKEVVP